ncbi:hypothetical protein KZ483_08700 [Paenibacillus sp. sptzw28]|uniref:hypothetical protein n=1 Tax=Paenibacillus sp. sptzw28 TaxID=715179 RepID=UPI001C6DE020|nr:hypothetical protein [Paenibacillus sp. sptzw28]QYR22988.1 hypothetical protein KZ483_08700 [Paenibacillus sp. sptzw28]
MKKRLKVAAIMIGLMMFAGVGSAYADNAPANPAASGSGVVSKHENKLEAMKEFQTQLHQIDNLKVDQLGLKSQIVNKQDNLIDLTIAAKENGNKDAIKQAAGLRKQIKPINAEIKSLHKSIKNQLKSFRKAEKKGKFEQAKSHINSAIEKYGQLNAKLGQKNELLGQMITALS